jgi:hypothetical protein
VSNSLTPVNGGQGGAGVYAGTLYNCIAYHNGPEANHSFATLNYSSTTPLPTNGFGNITNEPAFVDAAAGNYRLRASSPCIDAGTNLSAIIQNDLASRPRPMDGNRDGVGAFDMGAYEFGPAWPSASQLAFQPMAVFGLSDDEPQARSVIQGHDGNIYGTVSSYKTFPFAQTGMVFRLRPSGEVNILARFPGGDTNGFAPTVLVEAREGTFYGALDRVGNSQ